MAFGPPSDLERLMAIGSTGDLPETLRRAFDPGLDFESIASPRPGDWLASHPETGQTYQEFMEETWNRPGGARNRIFIQPIGDFERDASLPLATLEAYAKAFFSMDVKTLEPLETGALTTQTNSHTGNVQILTGDILGLLLKKLPGDAYCILGVTMKDLYPAPSWNFVFGQASLRDRVGVYSFTRYDPAFHGEVRQEGYQRLLLKRSLKVLSHETAHMFGLQHCIFYRCVINGSNHLDESDSRPLHLCPVCLRKLHHSVGFEVIERYRALLRFYSEAGLEEEAQWVSKRLGHLAEGSPPRIMR